MEINLRIRERRNEDKKREMSERCRDG